MFPLLTAICALKDSIAYRFRGGGFFSTGSNLIVRIVWGLSITLSYLILHLHNPIWYYLGAITPVAYVSMLVPHAYCQNMGRWPTPQKGWPSFFLPTLTDAQWTAWPSWARTLYDFVSMASVGFFRAAIVFGPLLGVQYGLGRPLSLARVGLAVAIVTIGQPLAYVIGWIVPVTIGSSLTKDSTEWCEFFNGGVWTLAFSVL